MKRAMSIALIGAVSLSLLYPGAAPDHLSTITNVSAAEISNLIASGNFETGKDGWGLYQESGGDSTVTAEGGQLLADIHSAGSVAHAVQVYFDGFSLEEGAKYRLTFDLASSTARTFEWRVQINGSDYHAYAGEEQVSASEEMQTFEYEFTMEEKSDPAPRFCFNLGDRDKAQGLGPHVIAIDNVCLTLIDDSGVVSAEEDQKEKMILVNQVGYEPDGQKRAVFRDASLDTEFAVVDTSGNVCFTGTLEASDNLGSSGDTVSYADFTELTTPGTYLVTAENSGESYPFVIEDDVYDDLYEAAVHMLYLQRCGSDLPEEEAGAFAHPACHTEKALLYGSKTELDVSGGWHDAGDYGRYIVPAAKTVTDLMLAYRKNGSTALLDECRYELEWMLKMQNEAGGVYHKVTGLNFDATVMPQECDAQLYVMPVSKTATGSFAASMYLASAVYSGIGDEEFAASCREAADRALTYLEAHIGAAPYADPVDVLTGEYPDECCQDELLWAYCEAYAATGDKAVEEKIRNFNYRSLIGDGLGWADVTGYACFAYLTCADQSEDITSLLSGNLIGLADQAKETAFSESYGSSIAEDYPWGSNMTIANNGMVMLMAWDLTGDVSYRQAANLQLDYLLGCNSTGYCFVSGFGTLCPEHPHHRPSQALGQAMPGMLAGGPDSGLDDPYAQNVLKNLPKAKCYADSDQTYSCNEVTIYWNSPLIYLLSAR